MKKTVLAIVFLVNAIFSLSAQQFKELTLAEKLAEPELSFALTFDKKDLNADFALGEKASLTLPDESLLLRGLVGFDSAGAYKPEPGESLKFAAPGNADPHQGTLSLWVCALDYNPCDELTEGEKRGNIALAQLWFQQGEKHINMQLYEYANTVYFDWRNSEPPHSFGQVARIQTLREGIRQGEWHQIVCTWQDKQIFLYLNGKLIDQAYLPEKCSKTADLQTEAEKSFIGVKSRFYEDNHKWAVGIDDYKIYSRALSALEVENRYKRLLDGEQALDIRAWDISLNGVNIGYDDPIERLEAEFDFAGLSAEKKETLLSGNLKMQYRLSDPQGNTVSQGDWSFTQARESKILSGLNQVGTYSLHTRIGDEEQSAEIYRPDFSWTGNQLGNEDSVPQIWRDFAVEGRQVRLWNRSYVFGAGPLPESIQAYGQELLLQTPQLLIADRDISWKAGPTIEKNSTVTYTGTGKAKDFSIEYATRVEFDGLIKMNFSINGEPELSDMRLQWRCRPELSTYLMTPRLQMQGGPQFAFQYPGDDEDHRQLWLVSEGKGGFAYSMQNDANWIYEKGEKLFFANQESGLCEVRMISKKVKMPPSTAYEALFIATPTRPLPRENRMLNFDGQRGTYGFLHAGGDGGLSGVFTMEPHPEGFTRKVAAARPNSYSVYGAANALTTLEPEAVYLRKYWDMPGSYSYKMPYHRPLPEGGSEKVYGFSLSACNSGVINDYYLKGIAKLFAHPYGDRIWQIYYDLCGNSLCRSAVHG
ncbi:MAG: DUF6067 family protein, partial [Lentisphaeria bacterium]|nr:DUF6067 family protein [Lentisphaeria bacterium]